MQVIKKNKNREDWNDEKIVKAILKSAENKLDEKNYICNQ